MLDRQPKRLSPGDPQLKVCAGIVFSIAQKSSSAPFDCFPSPREGGGEEFQATPSWETAQFKEGDPPNWFETTSVVVPTRILGSKRSKCPCCSKWQVAKLKQPALLFERGKQETEKTEVPSF